MTALGQHSLSKALDLDELVIGSLDEYEAIALRLARERSFLASVKEMLARNRNSAVLFDTERSTMMWERYQSGDMSEAGSGEAKPIQIS